MKDEIKYGIKYGLTIFGLLAINLVIGFIFWLLVFVNCSMGEYVFFIIVTAIVVIIINKSLYFGILSDFYMTKHTGIADFLPLIYLSLINPIITILYYITVL